MRARCLACRAAPGKAQLWRGCGQLAAAPPAAPGRLPPGPPAGARRGEPPPAPPPAHPRRPPPSPARATVPRPLCKWSAGEPARTSAHDSTTRPAARAMTMQERLGECASACCIWGWRHLSQLAEEVAATGKIGPAAAAWFHAATVDAVERLVACTTTPHVSPAAQRWAARLYCALHARHQAACPQSARQRAHVCCRNGRSSGVPRPARHTRQS